MDAEIQKKLREPFDAGAVGKLPRVWCYQCREAIKAKRHNCDQHQRTQCRECGNNMTTAHLHLDYIGHAAVTDRLLQVDPEWTWEPVAIGQDGLPVLDRNGGLWIRLTVAGVTRLGYGDAEGKQGGSAVKEAIGDALRNASMRFGVALDLWHKGDLHAGDDGGDSGDTAPRQERPAAPQQRTNGQQQRRPQQPPPDPPKANGKPQQWAPSNADEARKWLLATCEENGWDPKIVANRFKAASGEDLKTTDGTAAIVEFRASLFSVSDGELRKQPAANGAAR